MTKHFTFSFRSGILIIMVIGCSFLVSGCKKDKNPQETDVIFLGHRGAGNNGYNDTNMENTLSSAQQGIAILDGVELDIQMSMDGTAWIFHDAEVNNFYCSGNTSKSFIPLMTDEEISQKILCHGTKQDRIYKLSEVIELFKSTENGFYISLDIKTDFPTLVFNQIGGKSVYLLKMAEAIGTTIDVNAPEKILLEVNSKPFCDKLRSFPNASGFKFFLNSYEDMDVKIAAAKSLEYDGLSCYFKENTVNAESVKRAQNAGLEVQLWTPYYREELIETFGWQPDYIQTDNMNAKKGLNVK